MKWIWVLCAFILAVTDAPPIVEETEFTACPLTIAVLALKVTDPSENCRWLKEGLVLFDNHDTKYSIKRNESYNLLIIFSVSEQDNGTYQCQIILDDKSYKHKGYIKLLVRSPEECNVRQLNDPANNVCGVNLVENIRAVFSSLTDVLICILSYFVFKIYRRWNSVEKETRYDSININSTDEIAMLNKPVVTHPIQVLDGNEIEIERRVNE